MVAGADGKDVVGRVGLAAGVHHVADVRANAGNPQRHPGGLSRRAPEEIAEIIIVVGQQAFLLGVGHIVGAPLNGMVAAAGKIQQAEYSLSRLR